MSSGKEKCEYLKTLRKQIAEEYGLTYEPTECTHNGECFGTCPQCDVEIEDLQQQLDELGVTDIDLIDDSIAAIANIQSTQEEDVENMIKGMMVPPMLPGVPYPYDVNHRKRILLMECRITDSIYQNIEEVECNLYNRAPLKLVRERGNKNDETAIAVHFVDVEDDSQYKLGYLPRSLSKIMAVIMDMGWENIFEAEIDILHSIRNKSLHMRIYVLENRENYCVK